MLGKSSIPAFFAFELTNKFVFSVGRSLGMSNATAEQFAFDSAVTAASLVATAASLLTHDWLGAMISAAFIGASVLEHQLVRKRPRSA